MEEEKQAPFYGSFIEKSAILKIAHWAGIFAWVVLIANLIVFILSFTQFAIQLATGLFYQKGMSLIDLMSFFNPYLTMWTPGIVYFFGLKFVQHGLLILLEMEESARRTARSK
ncbi:MAG: hypothetical protein RIR73_33 [Chloroflexota bacterium]|jgi:hypothetical protein